MQVHALDIEGAHPHLILAASNGYGGSSRRIARVVERLPAYPA